MAAEQVRFGVVTEVHIVPEGTPEGRWHNPFLFDQAEQLFRDALARCVALEVDAIAVLGDLTHFADAESFARVRRVLETVDLPVYVLPGNHDLDKSDAPLAAFRAAMDLPHVTIAPAMVALTPAIDLALTGLDTADGTRAYTAVRSEERSGNAARLTVVLTHFPSYAMQPMLCEAELKHAGDLVNRAAFLEEIEAIAGPVLIVNGHLHVHATIEDGRLLQLSVAALIEPPHDVTLLTVGVDDNGHPWVTRQASGLFEVPGVRLPVLSAREEQWSLVDGVWRSGAVGTSLSGFHETCPQAVRAHS